MALDMELDTRLNVKKLQDMVSGVVKGSLTKDIKEVTPLLPTGNEKHLLYV